MDKHKYLLQKTKKQEYEPYLKKNDGTFRCYRRISCSSAPMLGAVMLPSQNLVNNPNQVRGLNNFITRRTDLLSQICEKDKKIHRLYTEYQL